ncbi:hypothetical protein L249_2992 [Ophiocordyceps polyrhachis-furcata BCC 54312]|uniref:Conserved oligomeric Golgi complex subunit 1 n=1 Tax=Ophiocordyceps polyrhachis-furcata BCC 54312 TaxID=1330021 RepID=A0A367LNK2_9HYPO|nr:hypothetical protein L249_2992 [Ophiocordyceps polyrhachis-furcata BCC 54312]
MGKKRRAPGRASEPQGPRELDPADARLGPISTFEDVADSEDEYFLARDQILLDDEPASKRKRSIDEDMELSDEEIFPYQDPSSDAGRRKKPKNSADDEEDSDAGWWGSSKQAYYDADKIETENDALEEEVEAKRLQKKKLSKMREEDFVFDGQEWLAGDAEAKAEGNNEATTELMKHFDVPDEIPPEDRLKILGINYPEFSYLVDEFQQLQPILKTLQTEAQAKPGQSLESIKYWILGCYVAALASYFAIFTSPARDGATVQKPLPPSELRDHDIMKTLVSCRQAWERVKDVKCRGRRTDPVMPDTAVDVVRDGGRKPEESGPKKIWSTAAKRAETHAKAKAIEEEVADLYDLPLGISRSKGRKREEMASRADDSSDFGEEDAMDAQAAADKASRRKSLRFYTSQIVQKANRRAGAGRDAGGDADIPHRERLRDRQARLLAEAEKRGKRGAKPDDDDGDDDDEEKEDKLANDIRADEDGYYNQVAQASKAKRDEKAARFAAYAAASKAERVVQKEEIGEDGKRKVTYAIEKNKGLAPKRNKDVRNPRVRRRKQFDAKQKKLRSMRPEWKGGEPKGGYHGERTGINAAVIKSPPHYGVDAPRYVDAHIFSAKYTLPQIRVIHNSLRAEIDDKSSRLRTQVGGSYRDLLGTADTIVQMRHDTGRLQDLLSEMGGRCGRSIVSNKVSGLASFVAGEEDAADTGRATRWKLLDACLLSVGRILRGQGGLEDGSQRVVLATKVWVLARLLIKSLHEEAGVTARRLKAPKKSIASLRRRLLGCVRRALERADGGDVLEPLCAYSLITSSGARDVLRHFLSVRTEAMTLAFAREEGAEDVLRSLRLYTTTLLQVQALVPAKLSPALARLKSQPLLSDAHLQRLESLQLDVRQRWCGEEMQLFTPFVRHDDLDVQQARSMLGDWASQGGRVNIEGLTKTLEHMTDPEAIIDLRTKVLRLWIRDGGRAKGFDPGEMQDDMRDVISSRMLAVLENKVATLCLVGSEVEATLENWQAGVSDKLSGLWDEDGYDTALADGAMPFMREVSMRLNGRSKAVSQAAQHYKLWVGVVDGLRKALQKLEKQRWENDYEEVEDEETIDARQQALSRNDPRRLQEKLDACLDAAFVDLDAQLGRLWERMSGEASSGSMAMYILRVLRDMRARLPDRPAARDLGLALVPSLHGSMVAQVSAKALDDLRTTFLPDRRVAGKPLWEGDPALPTQPSAGVFRFLHTLCQSMAGAGLDLWSATAVTALKKHACQGLVESWRRELAGLRLSSSDKTTGGEEGDDEEEAREESKDKNDVKRDVAIQWLFDLKSFEDEIYKQTGLEDEASRLRIANTSREYWQRTSLLFGLLG